MGPGLRIASIYAFLFPFFIKAKQNLKGSPQTVIQKKKREEESGEYFLCSDERRNTKSFLSDMGSFASRKHAATKHMVDQARRRITDIKNMEYPTQHDESQLFLCT